MHASDIDTLWEAHLSFVQDIAKENDGLSYLLVVVDVFSKYVWVRSMKNETARCLLEAFLSILSGGRKPEKLRTYKGREFLTSHSISILKRKKYSILCCISQNLKVSHNGLILVFIQIYQQPFF